MKTCLLRVFAGGVAASLFLFYSGMSNAATAGQVTHLSGTLSVKKADGTAKLFSVNSDVQEGDLLSTEAGTYARVKFVDGGEVVLRPGSQLKVANYSYNETKPQNDSVFLSLLKGGLRAVTGLIGKRNHDAVSFSTATATIGIRGTHFGALLCNNDCGGVLTVSGEPPENGLHVDVANGAVVVSNSAGSQVIEAGKFGFVRDASTAPAIVPPELGVRVTMPNSISNNRGSGHGVGRGGDEICVAQ